VKTGNPRSAGRLVKDIGDVPSSTWLEPKNTTLVLGSAAASSSFCGDPKTAGSIARKAA